MKLHNADLLRFKRINSVLAKNKLNKERDYTSAPLQSARLKQSANQYPKYI